MPSQSGDESPGGLLRLNGSVALRRPVPWLQMASNLWRLEAIASRHIFQDPLQGFHPRAWSQEYCELKHLLFFSKSYTFFFESCFLSSQLELQEPPTEHKTSYVFTIQADTISRIQHNRASLQQELQTTSRHLEPFGPFWFRFFF